MDHDGKGQNSWLVTLRFSGSDGSEPPKTGAHAALSVPD